MLDWAPAGNDADAYDLDGKDPGTDYAYITHPLRFVNVTTTKKEPEDFPGQGNYIKALNYYDDRFQGIGWVWHSSGLASTLGLSSYWTEFIGTKGGDDGDLYLVCKFGSGMYHKFWDTENATLREFCRGTFVGTDLTQKWVRHNSQVFEVSFGWMAHW